jgi:hypothetical protein
MDFFKKMIDFMTLGTSHPIRRLLAYYVLLLAAVLVAFQFLPGLSELLTGEKLDSLATTPNLLQDGLASAQQEETLIESSLEFTLSMTLVFLSTLAIMLPVTWVYMSARQGQGHNQSLVQTLLVLPMIVAGIVLIVSNSLALAFSLAGVVAAVRFRTNLNDPRDVVFVFLAIAVGFAAGVQVITIAFVLSFIFNFVLVLIWRYDFGRSVLEPTAHSQWAAPLGDLAGKDQGGNIVPDRDLVLALTPDKVNALANRFDRIRDILGSDGKKPKFDAVVTVTTSKLAEAQQQVEAALEGISKRWKLDEVITHTGKPSELYYLVRTRKSVGRDAMLTAIRTNAKGLIDDAQVEIGDALAREAGEQRQARKKQEQEA